MEPDFDFDEVGKQFDQMSILAEEVAKIVVPQYIAYRKMGLPVQEAAALTAAMVYHVMPPPLQEQSEK